MSLDDFSKQIVELLFCPSKSFLAMLTAERIGNLCERDLEAEREKREERRERERERVEKRQFIVSAALER